MGKGNLNLGKVEWHDHSFTNKEGKRENPYPGVVYLVRAARTPNGKPEKVYYIRYRTPDGKQRFENVLLPGVKMTPTKAAGIRENRMTGKELPNVERREAKKAEKRAAKAAVESRWDFSRLFKAYQEAKGEYPRRVTDDGNWRAHLVKIIGNKIPAELTSFDVDRIKRDMKKPRQVILKSRKPGGKDRVVERGPCKPGTIVAALGLLVRLSSFGIKRNLCEGIKFTIELPKGGTVKTEQMNDEQMSAYLKAAAACENRVIGAFLTFELLTGMRFSEVRNLEWSAVDLHHKAIHIRNPKGGRDQFIPLNAAAADIIENLPRDPDNPYVFQGEKGKKGKRSGRVGHGTVYRYGKKIVRAAGLPEDFRPNHGLRHSFASHLASSGEVDMYVLQKLLTHKSPTMTARYAHLRDETLRRGADVMGRVVKEAEKGEEQTGGGA